MQILRSLGFVFVVTLAVFVSRAEAQLGFPRAPRLSVDVNGDGVYDLSDQVCVSWWLSHGGELHVLLPAIVRQPGQIASAAAFFASPAAQLNPQASGAPLGASASGGVSADCSFIRGDANADDTVNLADAIDILAYLFQGGDPNQPLDASDVNDSGAVDLGDYFYLYGHLFQGGDQPCDPFPTAGCDPSVDALEVECYPLPLLHRALVSITHDPVGAAFQLTAPAESALYGDTLVVTNVVSDESITVGVSFKSPWAVSLAGSATDTLIVKLIGPKGFSVEVFPDIVAGIYAKLGLPPQGDPDPGVQAWFAASSISISPSIRAIEKYDADDYILADDWASVYVMRQGLVDELSVSAGDFIMTGVPIQENPQQGVTAQMYMFVGNLTPSGNLTISLARYSDGDGDGSIRAVDALAPLGLGSIYPSSVTAVPGCVMFVDMFTGQIRKITDTDSDGVVDTLLGTAFYTFPSQEWNEWWAVRGVGGLYAFSEFEVDYGNPTSRRGGLLVDTNQDGVADNFTPASLTAGLGALVWPQLRAGATVAWLRYCAAGQQLEVLDAGGVLLGASSCASGVAKVVLSRQLVVGEDVTIRDGNTNLSNVVSVVADTGAPILEELSPLVLAGASSIQLTLTGLNFDASTEVWIMQSDGLRVPCVVTAVTANSLIANAPGGHPPGPGFVLVSDAGETNLLSWTWLQVSCE